MNQSALRSFIAIAEHGSMRGAADAVHLTQSAISRQIKDLEAEFAAPLLERLPRGTALTSAGEAFLKFARDALASSDRVKSEISALRGLHTGLIRVAAPEAFMQIVLPECMTAFRRRYPGVSFDIRFATTRGVVSEVREGRADFGIAFNPEVDADMEIAFSIGERMVAAMAPHHPLADRQSLSMPEVADYALALPAPQSATGTLVYQVARATGVKLHAAIESSSVTIRVNMAVQSDVVAILAHISVVDLVRDKALVEVPMVEAAFNRGRIALFSMKGRRLSAAADAFQRMVHTELQSGRFRSRVSAGVP
jgi:DNA-binding transcriptional LysR family regulator